MTKRKTYTADVARDGSWWYVYVPETGHSTQAKRLEAEAVLWDVLSERDQVADHACRSARETA